MDYVSRFKEIEKKWQEHWDKNQTFKIDESAEGFKKKKFYGLVEFPYPSGAGLHVGHPRSYTAMDVICRKKRMENYNVLYPMGWDAFGLPTENFAIKTGIHPAKATEMNVANFKRQLKMLGLSFDWSKEVNTTDPNYYKWTQWIFLKLFEKGLAYKAEMPINWCPSCKVGLANEEVVQGVCDRCDTQVVRKNKKQWMLRITAYADRLIEDLNDVDYLERIKIQQINWIGRSYGAEIRFKIKNSKDDDQLLIFTTRPDTLFGATYMVLSPEHPLIEKYIKSGMIKNVSAVKNYQEEASKKSDMERTELVQKKSGVPLEGVFAINPASKEEIPIWISDYVLMSYGTGAIMAVPAHDQRDYDFAKTFNLFIRQVIVAAAPAAGGGGGAGVNDSSIEEHAYTDIEGGVMINSEFLNGLSAKDAIKRATDWVIEQKIGEAKVNFKLRDWVFSRQRYWGEPIPIVECPHCGQVPLPESMLPLTLPDVDKVTTSEDGESMLSKLSSWVETTCPKCAGPAKRETDTMPQWAGSSWYFLRYLDPHNDKAFASSEKIKYWMPIDWYNGGMEHTTLHLLYSRFWNKFLFDIGVVPCKEPYQKRTSHGMILGEDKEKMSKSRGNVINPDEIVNEYGADTFRMYEMFVGAFDQASAWNTQGVIGINRFLVKVATLIEKVVDDSKVDSSCVSNEEFEALKKVMHKTIKEVTERINSMKFNTAVSSLMTYVNHLGKAGQIHLSLFKTLTLLLHPFAPHLAAEMWQEKVASTANEGLDFQKWPEFDPKYVQDDIITIAVQITGKMRGTVDVAADIDEDALLEVVKGDEKISKYVEGKKIKKVIYVKGKIINVII
ncbi:MAG: leucine--tRNA ligase [Oligoflexia bacterium]|nr:leucine--tRNA ligase [Oligoflexia bacterium]